MTESPRPERRRLGDAPRPAGTPDPAAEPPTKPRKRPLSPLVVFLLTWIGTIFAAMILVQAVGVASVAAITRAAEGAGKFGLFLGIVAFLVARSRVKRWEEQQKLDQTREMVANKTGGMTCKSCGARILSTALPWQKESFCSEKCRKAHAGG